MPSSRSSSPLPMVFTVAEGRAAGLTPGRLRSSAWEQPFHGTRAAVSALPFDRLRGLMRALPPHAFACGPTAAMLHGLPLPSALAHDAWEFPTIGVPSRCTRIRRPGVTGRRLDVETGDVVEIRGIRCLAPLRVWAELAESLSVAQLTAVSDALLARRHPLATRDDLERTHRRFLGGRGSRRRRLAVDFSTDRSESPRESELRVLMIQGGLPTPECNVEIADGGRFIARVDMLFRRARVVVEYDGDHHRDPVQWSRDQVRRAELESLGYRYTAVTARDFDDPAALLIRIRRLLSAGA